MKVMKFIENKKRDQFVTLHVFGILTENLLKLISKLIRAQAILI